MEQAKSWLQQAIEIGDVKQIKSMALEDLDLEPLNLASHRRSLRRFAARTAPED